MQSINVGELDVSDLLELAEMRGDVLIEHALVEPLGRRPLALQVFGLEPRDQLDDCRRVAQFLLITPRVLALVDQTTQPPGFLAGGRGRPVRPAADRGPTLLARALDAIVEDEATSAGGRDPQPEAGHIGIPGDGLARRRRGQFPDSCIRQAATRRIARRRRLGGLDPRQRHRSILPCQRDVSTERGSRCPL